MNTRRRLPVLQMHAADADEPARPRWQWTAFGVVAIVSFWLVLASIAAVVGRAVSERIGTPGAILDDRWGAVVVVVLHVGALALAATFGGYVVGRYGGRAGAADAAIAGATMGVVALIATALAGQRGLLPATAVVSCVAAASAAIGARVGVRRR